MRVLARLLVHASAARASHTLHLGATRATSAVSSHGPAPASSSLPHKCVYFIMGGPGSGKGTQCEKLVGRFDMTHLSAGELLRREVASGSDEGKSIAATIADGRIVQSATTVGLLQAAMRESEGPFLIDGFPRSLENLRAYERAVGSCAFMLFLEVSEEEMRARLLKRGESSGRSDDNANTILKRFDIFVKESMPVVAELESRGMLRRIDAMACEDDVFARVCAAFDDQPHLRLCGTATAAARRYNEE